MESVGEQLPLLGGRIIAVDLATMEACEELAARSEGQGADLGFKPGRSLDILDGVGVVDAAMRERLARRMCSLESGQQRGA